jgi:hypothetical protein
VNEHAGHSTSQFHTLPLTCDKINMQLKVEAMLWEKYESKYYLQHLFRVLETNFTLSVHASVKFDFSEDYLGSLKIW